MPAGAGSCLQETCRPSLGESRWVYLPRPYPSCAAWGGVGALPACLLARDVCLGLMKSRARGVATDLCWDTAKMTSPSVMFQTAVRGLVLRRRNGFAGVKSRNPGISRDLRWRANPTPPPRNLPLHSRAGRVDGGGRESFARSLPISRPLAANATVAALGAQDKRIHPARQSLFPLFRGSGSRFAFARSILPEPLKRLLAARPPTVGPVV